MVNRVFAHIRIPALGRIRLFGDLMSHLIPIFGNPVCLHPLSPSPPIEPKTYPRLRVLGLPCFVGILKFLISSNKSSGSAARLTPPSVGSVHLTSPDPSSPLITCLTGLALNTGQTTRTAKCWIGSPIALYVNTLMTTPNISEPYMFGEPAIASQVVQLAVTNIRERSARTRRERSREADMAR
jgi:hypothetical protein